MLTTEAAPAARLGEVFAVDPFGMAEYVTHLTVTVEEADRGARRIEQILRARAALVGWFEVHAEQGLPPEVSGVEDAVVAASDADAVLDILFTRAVVAAGYAREKGIDTICLVGDEADELASVVGPVEIPPSGERVIAAALLWYAEYQGDRWLDSPLVSTGRAENYAPVEVDVASLSLSSSQQASI